LFDRVIYVSGYTACDDHALVQRFHETTPIMLFDQRLMDPTDQGKMMGGASLTHPTVLGDTASFMESVY
jgi:hypothetical protein